MRDKNFTLLPDGKIFLPIGLPKYIHKNKIDMKKNKYPGKFIVFEGLDGSGESTQVELLAKFLREQGISVLITKEPADEGIVGRFIRIILKGEEVVSDKGQIILKNGEDIPPLALQLMFSVDRNEHLEKVIIPALKNGTWVISDRYFYSTFAYGHLDNISLDWLMAVNDQYILPDLTFLLKVNSDICIERIEKRGIKKQRFEVKEKLERIWFGYEEVLKRFPQINLINGENSIQKVFSDIKKITEKFIAEVK